MMQLILYADNVVKDVFKYVTNPIKTENGVKWDNGLLDGVNVEWCLLHDSVSIAPDETITGEFIEANKIDPPLSELEQLKRQQTDLMFEMLIKGVV
jgi:hypothetical protein